jgi:nicotinate phosphoribosyltransferase
MITSQADVRRFTVPRARLCSATHEEILCGATTDVYFVKTRDVLQQLGRLNVPVTAEIFSRKGGIYAGVGEVLELLKGCEAEVWAVPEGEPFVSREVVMRVHGLYSAFGIFETAILGILASSSGWATAARVCVDAAGGRPVLSFGARHLHPSVASVMDKAAVEFGGCKAASSILGAKLMGKEPSGTIPHAAVLLSGDTLK